MKTHTTDQPTIPAEPQIPQAIDDWAELLIAAIDARVAEQMARRRERTTRQFAWFGALLLVSLLMQQVVEVRLVDTPQGRHVRADVLLPEPIRAAVVAVRSVWSQGLRGAGGA